VERKSFLSLLTSLSAAMPLGAVAAGSASSPGRAAPLNPDLREDNALVLSGGGARGAYQAGAIAALVQQSGVRDGEPLPSFDVICGSSIGALNGWFVATGQYTLLSQLWQTIGKRNIFVLKKRYAAAVNPDSGLLNRLDAALALEIGLVTDVRGVLDDGHVARWIAQYIDPATPILRPFVFTVTNLDHERGELFYRAPPGISAQRRAQATRAIEVTVGPSVIARPAGNDILHKAIRASAAMPVLFDPVQLPGANGKMQDYVDGGIANNTPVDVARALTKNVYSILLDPDIANPPRPRNAIEVGITSFTIAQRRILESALRATYLETAAKRATLSRTDSQEVRSVLNDIFDCDLYTIRPAAELPLGIADFTNQSAIDASYQLGYNDTLAGWQHYKLPILP
jgi:predicted acylesterase/phospholipase RssA